MEEVVGFHSANIALGKVLETNYACYHLAKHKLRTSNQKKSDILVESN